MKMEAQMRKNENNGFTWACLIIACLAFSSPAIATSPQDGLSEQQKNQVRSRFKEDAAAILKVIDRWAKAWSDLDVDNYIACYSDVYVPANYSSNKVWQQSRRDRFKNQKWVKLGLTGMVLTIRGNASYAVEFTQKYESDTYRDSTRKELLFKSGAGGWEIVEEKIIKNKSR